MYDKLEYDPSTKGPLVDRYPELSKYPEFSDSLGDKLLRYCILYYDESSPFFKNKDLDDRRNRCYESVKADIELRNEVEAFGEKFRAVTLRWFKLHHSYLFEEWVSRKFDFHENNLYLSTPFHVFADVEKAIQRKELIKKNLENDRTALLGLENALFKDDKTKKMLTKAANESSLSGYAEKMARNFFEELEENG